MRKRRRNAVEQDIPEPERRNNQAFLKVNIPVAHTRKQFAHDVCDNDVRSDSASDAQERKENACDVVFFLVSGKQKNPREQRFLFHITLVFRCKTYKTGQKNTAPFG